MGDQKLHISGRRAALAAASFVLLMSGCGEDSVERALRDATVSLHTMSAAGGMVVPADSTGDSETPQERRYAEILRGLESVRTRTPAEASAVHLLKARSHAGIGEVQSARLRQRERRALDQIGAIRALHDQWLGQRGTAAALEQYDVREPIARLDAEIARVRAEAAQQQEELGGIERELAGLEARAGEKRSRITEQRAQDSALRLQMSGASETRRAALLEEASGFRRAADTFEKEAGYIEADAAAQRPRLERAQTMIDRLNTQIRLLEAEKNALSGKAAASQTSARQIRSDLGRTSGELNAELATLDELVAQTQEPLRLAQDRFRKAAAEATSAAKSGRSPGASAGAVAAASYYQHIGDVLFDRIRGIVAYHHLMRGLAEAGSELPGDFAGRATAAEAALSEARIAAGEAYASAIERLESVGGGDEVRQRIEALKRQIADLKSYALDEKDAPPPKTAVATNEGSQDGEPVDAAAVEAEVRAAFRQLSEAIEAGDLAAMKGAVTVESEEHRPALEAMSALLDKAMAFGEAFKAKFGVSFAEKAEGAMAGMGGMNQLSSMAPGLGDLSIDDAEIEVISSSEVVLKTPDEPEGLRAVRKDGRWLMVLPAEQAEQLAAMEPALSAIGKALDDTASEIASGRYPNADLVMPILMQRIFGAMQKMPGGGFPGMGGGGG